MRQSVGKNNSKSIHIRSYACVLLPHLRYLIVVAAKDGWTPEGARRDQKCFVGPGATFGDLGEDGPCNSTMGANDGLTSAVAHGAAVGGIGDFFLSAPGARGVLSGVPSPALNGQNLGRYGPETNPVPSLYAIVYATIIAGKLLVVGYRLRYRVQCVR